MASDYSLQLRPGYKFKPSDGQLIEGFLRRRVAGGEPRWNYILPEINLYGRDSLPPWELFDPSTSPIHDDQQHWYCFTPLKKKGKGSSSSHFDRTVGESGSWVASQRRHNVVNHQNRLLGHKRVYNFFIQETGKDTKTKTLWLMHEFTLPDPCSPYALCRVVNRIPRDPLDPDEQHERPVLPLDAPFPFPLYAPFPLDAPFPSDPPPLLDHHQPPSKKQCIRPPITPSLPPPDVPSTSTSTSSPPSTSSSTPPHLITPPLPPDVPPHLITTDVPVDHPDCSSDDELIQLLECTLDQDEEAVPDLDVPVDHPNCSSDDELIHLLECTLDQDVPAVQPGAWSSLLLSSNDAELDGCMF